MLLSTDSKPCALLWYVFITIEYLAFHDLLKLMMLVKILQ